MASNAIAQRCEEVVLPLELQPTGVVVVCDYCHREHSFSYDEMPKTDSDERRCLTCCRALKFPA
jgi:hypothetical protein